MGVRIVTGVILAAVALAWMFLADYAVFAIGALLIYAVSAYEMGPLLGFKQRVPFMAVAAVAAALCFFFARPGMFAEAYGHIPAWCYGICALSLLVWIPGLPIILNYPKWTAWRRNLICNTVIGLFLLLPFLMGLLILRAHAYADDPKSGAWLLLSVMALVWLCDSGAYFTGRCVGKTPMLPKVSPHKTREGLYGGLALALLGLALFMNLGWYGDYGQDRLALTIAGLVTILASVEGDLMESVLKRMAGIKDSGKIFPGHGGMLDRVDSQLAAVPIFITVHGLVSLAAGV